MEELIKAVNSVMNEAKSVSKNSNVGFGKSSYKGVKDLDVKQTLQPLMAKHGLAMFQTSLDVKTSTETWEESYNGQSKRKKQVFTEVIAKYRLMHSSGQYMDLEGVGHGVDTQDKSVGKAQTYALKMILLYTFLVPTGEIDDTDTTHSNDYDVPNTTKQKEQPKSDKAVNYIIAELNKGAIAALMDDQQKRIAAMSILDIPKEERRAWISIAMNWIKEDGVVSLLAELAGLNTTQPSARKNRLKELNENTLKF